MNLHSMSPLDFVNHSLKNNGYSDNGFISAHFLNAHSANQLVFEVYFKHEGNTERGKVYIGFDHETKKWLGDF
jgi:hypothetical protein